MKKLLKWTAIIIVVLIVVLIIGVVALPFIIPLEKIKDFAAARISEAIKREVKIEKVSFDIFSGIKLEKLTISNRQGFAQKPFVSADAIALRYAFWPLFKRQIIIKEIRLVKPEILIEKSKSGVFNFSDMTGERKQKVESRTQSTGKKTANFSMVIDTFSIRDAKITYVDYGTQTSAGLKDADLTVSGITLAMLKPIGLDFAAVADYKGKDVPLGLSGKIAIDLKKGVYNIPSLNLKIAGEKADISATISNLKAGPDIDFSIASKKLGIDPLLAVLSAGATAPKEKKKLKPGELTTTINKLTASLPAKLKVNGKVSINNFAFQEFKVDKVDLALSLADKKASADIKEIAIYDGTLSGKADVDLKASGLGYSGNLRLSGFNAAPFSNAVVETFLTKLPDYKDLVDKVYGRLDVSVDLRGTGVEVPDILANAVASGSFSLKNGELKRLKTIDAIADKIKTPGLKQDMKISELSGEFSMKNQVVDIKELDLRDHDINAAFKGGIDLAKLKFVAGNRLMLKASPASTQGLSKEYNLLRDEKGWLEVTFELTGDLKKPIPVPVLEKPVEKAVGKLKVKIEAKKMEIEEEAKKKLEEEAKKQLKDLIKF